MTERELKRLKRTDLIGLLLDLTRENEQLKSELEETRAKLESREIMIEESGSLAQAAMELNGVFKAAQEACEQYIYNIRLRAGDIPSQDGD